MANGETYTEKMKDFQKALGAVAHRGLRCTFIPRAFGPESYILGETNKKSDQRAGPTQGVGPRPACCLSGSRVGIAVLGVATSCRRAR